MFNLDGIGMIQADAPAFRFSRVNSKFCKITGYTAAELLAKTYVDITHPLDRNRGLKELARIIRGKTNAWSIEKRCVRKDGRVIWVSVHGTALRDHVGQTIKIMATIEDVTERKADEQPRTAQEQAKKPLQERTAEISQMLQSLRNQVARLRLTDKVHQAIHEIIDRFIEPGGDRSSPNRRKPVPQKKAASKETRKSTPGKRRSPSR